MVSGGGGGSDGTLSIFLPTPAGISHLQFVHNLLVVANCKGVLEVWSVASAAASPQVGGSTASLSVDFDADLSSER